MAILHDSHSRVIDLEPQHSPLVYQITRQHGYSLGLRQSVSSINHEVCTSHIARRIRGAEHVGLDGAVSQFLEEPDLWNLTPFSS
jgi:hypothetical protein